MSMESSDLYEMVIEAEQELSHQYDSLPAPTSDAEIELSARANGGIMLDHEEQAVYIDPTVTYIGDDKVKELTEFGVKHLKWHPNHGLRFRNKEFNQRNFYGNDQVSEHQPVINGEEIDTNTEGAARDLYRSAVNHFQDLFETDFREPSLHIIDDIQEYSEWFDANVQVGYEIDHENDRIFLNSEIVGDLHPQLLNEDFRHMLKRYHDLSAEETVRDRVIPYVENLRPDGELQVEDVVFKELSDNTIGAYNNEQQRMKLDYSLLPLFNPRTGLFEGSKGSSTMLHEGVHDLDFSVNENSRNYLSAIADVDTKDPRNAVLEAPTTFEVYMAGWNTRPNAVEAFKNPLSNRDFFRDYPAEDMQSSSNDSIAYPYNMGLITALSIHQSMMGQKGVEEGTETTRDILYGNAWDLKHMGLALESSFEQLGMPNIPKHRREVTEIAEKGSEALMEEAERLIDEVNQDNLEATVRGREVVHEYEALEGFGNPPEVMDDLDRLVYQVERQSEEL